MEICIKPATSAPVPAAGEPAACSQFSAPDMARNGQVPAIPMVYNVGHRARGELSVDAIAAISRHDRNARAIDQDRHRLACGLATVVAAPRCLSLLTVAAAEGEDPDRFCSDGRSGQAKAKRVKITLVYSFLTPHPMGILAFSV
jgi:hypothetical protein